MNLDILRVAMSPNMMKVLSEMSQALLEKDRLEKVADITAVVDDMLSRHGIRHPYERVLIGIALLQLGMEELVETGRGKGYDLLGEMQGTIQIGVN